MFKDTEMVYKTPDYPRQLRLDTTTKCNAKCLSCHRFNAKHRHGEMGRELLEEILKDVSRWKPPLEEIIPVNYGEFFRRDDWVLILAKITQYLPHTQIVIPTNGALIKKSDIRELASVLNLNLLNFSVNAFFDSTYRAFNALNPKNIDHIKGVIKALAVHRPDMVFRVSMVFDPVYASDLQRDFFVSHWLNFKKETNIDIEPWILPAASCDRGTKIQIPRIIPCRSIFSDIVVGYDRKLSLCCFDSRFHLDLGWYSGDLKADWRNDKIENLRRIHNEHRRQEIALCLNCTYE